jgi:hypothetical protein
MQSPDLFMVELATAMSCHGGKKGHLLYVVASESYEERNRARRYVCCKRSGCVLTVLHSWGQVLLQRWNGNRKIWKHESLIMWSTLCYLRNLIKSLIFERSKGSREWASLDRAACWLSWRWVTLSKRTCIRSEIELCENALQNLHSPHALCTRQVSSGLCTRQD